MVLECTIEQGIHIAVYLAFGSGLCYTEQMPSMKAIVKKLLAFPAVKEVGGAAAGALCALVLYYAFQSGAAIVGSALSVQETPSVVQSETDESAAQRQERREAVAKAVREQLGRDVVQSDETQLLAAAPSPVPLPAPVSTAVHAQAASLPASGVSVWVCVCAALLSAVYMRRRAWRSA